MLALLFIRAPGPPPPGETQTTFTWAGLNPEATAPDRTGHARLSFIMALFLIIRPRPTSILSSNWSAILTMCPGEEGRSRGNHSLRTAHTLTRGEG